MTTEHSARFNMIEQQVRPWEVIDFKVLHTMELVDRIDFVDEQYRGLAYADCQIPVAEGVSMLPPTIEGRLLQALQINPADKILEIGCTNGYLTACLANLGHQVVTTQTNEQVLEKAQANIEKYHLQNIEYRQLASNSLSDVKAFDVIAVTGSLAEIPINLKQALALGGRLFVVCGQPPIMEATLVTRSSDNDWQTEALFETSLPRLNC